MTWVEVSGYWAPCQCVNPVMTPGSYPSETHDEADPRLQCTDNPDDKFSTNMWHTRCKPSDPPQLWTGRCATPQAKHFPVDGAIQNVTTSVTSLPCPAPWERDSCSSEKSPLLLNPVFIFNVPSEIYFLSICISFSSLLPMLIFQSAASCVPEPAEFLCQVDSNHPVAVKLLMRPTPHTH